MAKKRPLHPTFRSLLELKDKALIDLFIDLREYILDECKNCNELLYHTHALTAVFSTSEKLQDAFCMIPIYSNHLNLGFNKGTLLKDPYKLLTGTGKLIRHIDVEKEADFRNAKVKSLLKEAFRFAVNDMDAPAGLTGQIISKIKK